MADLPNSTEDSIDKTPDTLEIPIKPDDPEKSVSGRVFYIVYLAQYCEGFWESLRDHVLHPCLFFAYRASGQPIPEGLQESAQACFDKWLLDWQITDEWLIKTCHYVISAWAMQVHHGGRAAVDNCHPLPVWYGPSEANLAAALPRFSPVFEQPYPSPLETLLPEERSILADEPLGLRMYEASVARESSAAFKKRMRDQFDLQLAEYSDRCEAKILEQKNMRRDAAWTALFQCGLSPKSIEAWEFGRSGNRFSHARIQQAVKGFASAIGLTLRKPKAGRNAKRKG
jgi:hypothetical protein